MLGNYLQQMSFSDAFSSGTLRVNSQDPFVTRIKQNRNEFYLRKLNSFLSNIHAYNIRFLNGHSKDIKIPVIQSISFTCLLHQNFVYTYKLRQNSINII